MKITEKRISTISRRDFLKGTVSGAALLLAGTLSEPILSAKASDEEISSAFSAESSDTANRSAFSSDVSDTANDSETRESVTLVMPMLYATEIPDDVDLVNEAVSELTLREIGINIQLVPILYSTTSSGADQLRQTELELLEKEGVVFDILPAIIQSGAFQPLNSLLENYGGDIVQLIGEKRLSLLQEKDGSLYTLPSASDYVSSFGLTMRKDIVEKYEIDLSSIKTFSDISEIFGQISPQEPELYMISGYRTQNGFIGRLQAEQIVISPFCSWSEDQLTLENYYATDFYAETVSLFYNWNLAGYIPPNIMIQNIESSQLVKAGILFSYFSPYKPNIEQDESLNCGYEMETIQLMEPLVTATSMQITVRWGINESCQYPEKAMQLLNLLYTNADLINLLSYGIKGTHYVIQDDGTINYPDGITADTCGYVNTQAWLLPNQYPSLVWNGNDPNLWEEVREYNESASYAETVDFSWDSSALESELARIDGILDTYTTGLECGMLDPAVYLPQMLEELDAAGAERVLSAIQAAYNAQR